MLKKFMDNYAEAPGNICQALGKGDRQLAERLDCPVAAGSLRSGCWEKIK